MVNREDRPRRHTRRKEQTLQSLQLIFGALALKSPMENIF
jgi:hypothetical protein